MEDPVRAGEQPDNALRITIEHARPDAIVVRLAGDLDLLTAPQFRERLWPMFEQPEQTLIVDLSGVDFLGSAGLAELAAAHDKTTGQGIKMLLVAGSRMVLRPLEVTGLHTLFQIYDSVDAALEKQ